MNIVSKRVLAGAAVIVAYACATPVDISGDVLTTDPSEFGDAGVFAGAGGGASGSGGGDVGDVGGEAGSAAQAGTGGSGPSSGGTGGTNGGTGGTFQAGLGGSAPLGGSGGSNAAGSAGSSAGTGGVAALGGSGGVAAVAGSGGTTATAGTGGTGVTPGQPVFDAEACDFDVLTGCDDLTCQAVCPTNDGNSCLNRCNAVVDCVTTNVTCVTEDDPLCGVRNGGTPNVCTTVVEPAGGPDPDAPNGGNPQPSFVARQFVECICSDPRP